MDDLNDWSPQIDRSRLPRRIRIATGIIGVPAWGVLTVDHFIGPVSPTLHRVALAFFPCGDPDSNLSRPRHHLAEGVMIRAALAGAALLAGCSPEAQDARQLWDAARQPPDCRGGLADHQPEHGIIPTERIAADVAYPYLHAAFPQDRLRPLSARLRHGVWTVSGHFPKGDAGGPAILQLCQSNGRVLRLWHEQ